MPGSVTIFQPTLSCFRFAVSVRMPRSCGLSTPVCLPPRVFWNALMAATMRSLTSPVIAPLYWPAQARSDCSARRSACAIALAVSAGVCRAGRIGTVATCFGLAPAVDGAVICAWADVPATRNAVMHINVAASIDLMTNPGSIDVPSNKHICLVGNNRALVQGTPAQGNGPDHAERRRTRTLRPPYRAARSRRPRPGRVEGGCRAGDRRRRARRPGADVSRRRRRRHARRGRRRHRLAVQPAAPDHPRHAGYRPAQGRQRRDRRFTRSIRMSSSRRMRRGWMPGMRCR